MTLRPSRSAALLALLLAACGSADERPSAAADSAAVAPPPPAVASADADTASCPPEPGDTVMRVRADGPEYRFRIFARPDEGESAGGVDSIVVRRGCARVQALVPAEDEIPPEMEIDRLSLVDLDFDGHGDLAFVSLMGMANSISEYWRFDPASGRFVPLGSFATFEVDSARRELKTYVRGGHAGLLFTAARYRVQGGRPVKVREESQDVLDDVAGYVRIVRELRGGALTETARDTLTEEEAIRSLEERS
jgi:hypothetical protein